MVDALTTIGAGNKNPFVLFDSNGFFNSILLYISRLIQISGEGIRCRNSHLLSTESIVNIYFRMLQFTLSRISQRNLQLRNNPRGGIWSWQTCQTFFLFLSHATLTHPLQKISNSLSRFIKQSYFGLIISHIRLRYIVYCILTGMLRLLKK